MKKLLPIVNSLDKSRLAPHLLSGWHDEPATRVRNTLTHAQTVPPSDVPSDVVTMNSRVVVRYPEDADTETYVLAYPNQDTERGISVLSPLGSALLAAREGQLVRFMGARSSRSFVIDAIEYQPERVGHFDV
jgi:regulator of nucleoside diphosphate kinase